METKTLQQVVGEMTDFARFMGDAANDLDNAHFRVPDDFFEQERRYKEQQAPAAPKEKGRE